MQEKDKLKVFVALKVYMKVNIQVKRKLEVDVYIYATL